MDENARTGELRRKLEKDPGSRLFAQLAEELRKEGKHDEAISVARKGLEKNPNYPSARLTLARALLDSGRPAEARPELESIVKNSPDNIMASRLLGDALAELGETAQALQQFERTLLISPGDKVVMERMAEVKVRIAAAAFVPPAVAEVPVAEPLAPSVDSLFPDAAPVPSPAPIGASVALDRDLASGTFSPGALNAADIQKHFDEASAPAADVDATVGFGEMERSVDVPPPPAPQDLPSVEMPPGDGDLGATTLPLTSLTLADLYLQQGLKAEASAVLSQVLQQEPENAQARSKFNAVSGELAQAQVAAAVVPPPISPVEAKLPVGAAPTRAELRERTIFSLKAFASAVEREAVHQKATERGVFH